MTYRTAVVGTGGLGTILGRQVRRQPRTDLVALVDVSAESRAKAGSVLDVPPDARFNSLEELLEAESLDALVVATPHTLHYDHVLAALERNVHVLCEKPLVTDLERARALHQRTEATETVVMVGYQRHLEPEYRFARNRWAEGEATPSFLSAEITENWLSGNFGTWRANPELSGGGFLYDTGNHVIDAILWTTGLTPVTVTAEMDFELESIDTRANLTVEFEEDTTAHASFYGDATRVTERLLGWDDDGGVRIEGREWRDRSITVIDEDGNESDPYLAARDSAYETPRTKIDAFADAIDDSAPVPATTKDALRATAVTEAAYESAQTGTPVEVAI